MLASVDSILQIARNAPTIAKAVKRRVIERRPWAFSFDLADRCPAKCDCYWRQQQRVEELSDERVVEFFEEKNKEGYVHVTIVGGEPYVRPELLGKVTPIILINWIATSGTTPLRRFPNTTHMISIDGGDAETHNRIRRSPNLYERIVKHLTEMRRDGEFPAYIHSTLNSLSYDQVEQIMETWSKNGLVDGAFFSTATPIEGVNSKPLSVDQRIEIVDTLHEMKEKFGRFLCMTHDMVDRLHPAYTANLTPENCPTANFISSFDAAGVRKEQCILSREVGKAHCTECGCYVGTTETDNLRQLYERVKLFSKLNTIGRT